MSAIKLYKKHKSIKESVELLGPRLNVSLFTLRLGINSHNGSQ